MINSLENFLKSYDIDIYDFISYIDDSQFEDDGFNYIYNEVIINHKINDIIPIQISKKYIKNNIDLYKRYYFNDVPSSKWVSKAFSFRNNVLNIEENEWYNIHVEWQEWIKNYKKITIFNSRQKSKNQTFKNIKI